MIKNTKQLPSWTGPCVHNVPLGYDCLLCNPEAAKAAERLRTTIKRVLAGRKERW